MTLLDKLSIFIYDYLWGMPMVILLVGTAIITTLASKGFTFRYFGAIIKAAFHRLFGKQSDNKENGILSSLQATSMALGTTIGVGNISGVASAIAVGGPGAVFWMWISALFGMTLKMCEITLAVHYRQHNEDGEAYGSPLHYMEKGIGRKKGLKGIAALLIIIMIIGALSTFFINIQTYTVSEAVGNTFGISLLAVAIVYTVLLYVMIGNGLKGLGKISSILVPIMCLFYIIVGIIIILLNISVVPGIIADIVKSAFTGSAAAGGFLGSTMMMAMRTGVSRGVFSNEAGWGTAPLIHASAKVDHPVKQGIMGVFEVFMDTFVICTITALVVLISGEWLQGDIDGATLTLTAFQDTIGYVGRIILALSVFIFGLTTSSGVYAQLEGYVKYVCDKFHCRKETILLAFKWLYPLPSLIMVIIAVTNGLPGTQLWLLSDMTTAIPIFSNCIAILFLIPVFSSLINDYKARYLGKGTVNPDEEIFFKEK